MKTKIFYLIVFSCMAFSSFGQSNLIIFSETGDNFTLFVNGERKNAAPGTNVKALNLNGDGCKVRIVFQDVAIPEISKYIMLTSGEETTFGINKNKKGSYVLRMVSTAQINTSTASADYTPATSSGSNNTQETVTTTTYTTTQPEAATVTMTTAQPQTATQTTTTANNASMSINVSDNGDENVSFSMNVNATDGKAAQNNNANISMNINAPVTTTSSSTTTTTTTSSVKSSGNTGTTTTSSSSFKGDCAMTESDFNGAVQSIKSKSFADTKMSVAKQALKNRCVTTEQVKTLANLFTFEEDKFQFVKYAYDFTSDKDNFYKLGDSFTYDSTVEELNEFLDSKK